MVEIIGVFIPIAFIVASVLSYYFFVKARNTERMAMIEKGISPPERVRKSDGSGWLKMGIFIIGISLGIFMGYIMDEYTAVDDVVGYFSMILLFGGLSLILNYFIQLKLEKK